MSEHTFLSDEWVAAVADLKAEYAGNPVDQPGLVVNATITGVPFGEPTRRLHSDHGPVIGWEAGHADDAVVSLTLEYHLARELALDDSFAVLSQAADSGSLVIEGDEAALRSWWKQRIANPRVVELDKRVRALTA